MQSCLGLIVQSQIRVNPANLPFLGVFASYEPAFRLERCWQSMAKCHSVSGLHTDLYLGGFVQDAKVVDNACLALSRIAEAFAHRPASLNMLCDFGLISNAVQLVSTKDSSAPAPLPSRDAGCPLW